MGVLICYTQQPFVCHHETKDDLQIDILQSLYSFSIQKRRSHLWWHRSTGVIDPNRFRLRITKTRQSERPAFSPEVLWGMSDCMLIESRMWSSRSNPLLFTSEKALLKYWMTILKHEIYLRNSKKAQYFFHSMTLLHHLIVLLFVITGSAIGAELHFVWRQHHATICDHGSTCSDIRRMTTPSECEMPWGCSWHDRPRP